MEEIWKDVVGYEGLYQVSNLGRVSSIKGNYKNTKIEGSPYSVMKGSKPNPVSLYRSVLLRKNNVATLFRIHRLVGIAFIKNPLNLPEINHKDGIKTNNMVDNLEWSTHQGNMTHMMELGLLVSVGEKSCLAKLTNDQVREIRSMEFKRGDCRRLAKVYGLCHQEISNIKTGKRWKSVK